MKVSMKAVPKVEQTARTHAIAKLLQRENEKARNAALDSRLHNLHVMIIRAEDDITACLKSRAPDVDKISRLSKTVVELRAELRRARKGKTA